MNKTGKGGLAERKQHINRKGRPKDFASLRVLAQQIAHEEVAQSSGDARTVTELILRKWAGSNDARLQMAFVEYAFGKVPAQSEISGKNGESIKTEGKIIIEYADMDLDANPSHAHIEHDLID